MVQCPFKDCSFQTNVCSTFDSHKSRNHKSFGLNDFRHTVVRLTQFHDVSPLQSDLVCSSNGEPNENTDSLKQQLEHNLASLLLKTQTALHFSESATQEMLQGLDQLRSLSSQVLEDTVTQILQTHNCGVSSEDVTEIVNAVVTNVLRSYTSRDRPLSTPKRRKSYYEQHFPVVKSIEYRVVGAKYSTMYVPILSMLQELLKKRDVLEQILQLGCPKKMASTRPIVMGCSVKAICCCQRI